MKAINIFFGLLFSAVLTTSFIISKEFTDSFLIPKHFYFLFTSATVLFIVILAKFLKKATIQIKITWIDLFVYSFFLYLTLHNLFFKNVLFDTISYINLLFILILYIVFKPYFEDHSTNKTNKLFSDTFIVILLLVGISHSLIGIAQYFGVIKNLPAEFNITGTFGNPGSFANIIVLILPFALMSLLFCSKKIIKFLGAICVLLILLALPLTEARTAWVAAIVIVIYSFVHTGFFISYWNKYFQKLLSKALLVLVFLSLIFSGVYILRNFKQDSASGRLFIWKVSMEMIKDKPLFGHGYASFHKVHNDYQAEYFRENPTDWKNGQLADATHYAFNEYIQISSEIGIIGLIIFMLLLASVFYRKRPEQGNSDNFFLLAAEGAILSFLICAFFSYPMSNVTVLFILFSSIAIVSAKRKAIYKQKLLNSFIPRIASVLLSVFLIYILVLSVNRYNAEKKWKKAFHKVRIKDYKNAQRQYAKIYPIMKYNPFFLYNYGAELTVMKEYQKSIDILKEVENKINDADYYIYLGSDYIAMEKYQAAIQCYEQATNVMPVKFYPKYKLVMLYEKVGEREKAYKLAKNMLETPVKIDSDITRSILAEMKKYVEFYKNNFSK